MKALATAAVLGAVALAVAWMIAGQSEPGTVAPAGLQTAEPASPRPAADAARATLPFYPPNQGHGWTSLGVTAAHAAMVMRITVDDGADPMSVAEEIVDPLKPNYVEVLIYVHDADHEAGMPIFRIQWTPRGGFVRTDFVTP